MAQAAINSPANELLAFDEARLILDPEVPPTQPINLILRPGDLVLLDVRDPAFSAAFVDAVVGLGAPASGQVRFLGRDWSGLGDDEANAMRGRIGLLVAEGDWIEQLPTMENVLLGQLHHTERRRELLMNDAARLARRFGLPGVPLGLPGLLTESDRHRAALVRTFLGRPRLIVLEPVPPLSDPELMQPLVNVIRGARDRGAAVLWLTLNPRLWRDPSLPATRRLRLIGEQLLEGVAS